MGEPLDGTTGMLRVEIEKTIELEVTKTKEQLRDETRRELTLIRSDVSAIRAKQTETAQDIKNLQDGQHALQAGQTDLTARMNALESNVKDGTKQILEKIAEINVQTMTITEETADGRKFTKHFRSWSTVSADIRKFWPHGVALFFGYKAFAGWMAAHGITWATVWVTKH